MSLVAIWGRGNHRQVELQSLEPVCLWRPAWWNIAGDNVREEWVEVEEIIYRKITLYSVTRVLSWETGIQNSGIPTGRGSGRDLPQQGKVCYYWHCLELPVHDDNKKLAGFQPLLLLFINSLQTIYPAPSAGCVHHPSLGLPLTSGEICLFPKSMQPNKKSLRRNNHKQ